MVQLHAMFIELETLLSLFSFHLHFLFFLVSFAPHSSFSLFLDPLLDRRLRDPFRSYEPPPPPFPGTSFLSLDYATSTEEEETESWRGESFGSGTVSVFREKVPFAIFSSTTASGTPQYWAKLFAETSAVGTFAALLLYHHRGWLQRFSFRQRNLINELHPLCVFVYRFRCKFPRL